MDDFVANFVDYSAYTDRYFKSLLSIAETNGGTSHGSSKNPHASTSFVTANIGEEEKAMTSIGMNDSRIQSGKQTLSNIYEIDPDKVTATISSMKDIHSDLSAASHAAWLSATQGAFMGFGIVCMYVYVCMYVCVCACCCCCCR
jgi:hypothetical protein